MDANIEIERDSSRANRNDFIDSSLRDLECAGRAALGIVEARSPSDELTTGDTEKILRAWFESGASPKPSPLGSAGALPIICVDCDERTARQS